MHGERNYEQNAAGVQRLVARVGRTTATAVLTTPPAGDGAVRRLDGRKGLWVGAPVLVVVARRECPSAAKQLFLARHVRHDGLRIAEGRVRRRARISETQHPEALHMHHGRARSTEGLRRRHAATESDRGTGAWRGACVAVWRGAGVARPGQWRGLCVCQAVWHAQKRAGGTWAPAGGHRSFGTLEPHQLAAAVLQV